MGGILDTQYNYYDNTINGEYATFSPNRTRYVITGNEYESPTYMRPGYREHASYYGNELAHHRAAFLNGCLHCPSHDCNNRLCKISSIVDKHDISDLDRLLALRSHYFHERLSEGETTLKADLKRKEEIYKKHKTRSKRKLGLYRWLYS